MNNKKSRHTIVIGKTGSGKSHLLKESLTSGYFGFRVIIVDIQDEYGNVKGFENEKSIGVAIKQSIRGVDVFRWRFVIDADSREVEDVFRLAFGLGDVVIIAEEVGAYQYSRGLERCVLRGRSRGVHVVVSTQRPYTVSRTVSSQMATGIIFAIDEPRDLKYVADRWGWGAVHDIQKLKKYESNVVGDIANFKEVFTPKGVGNETFASNTVH